MRLVDYRQKILASGMGRVREDIQQKALKEVERLGKTPVASPEIRHHP